MSQRPLHPADPAPNSSSSEEPSSTTMRASVIDATGVEGLLHEAEVPIPSPILGELLVRIVAAGINPIDAKTRAGAGVSAAIPVFPSTLGFDFSGVVEKSPFESHPFPVGTEVYGMLPFPRTGGSYAEYAVVPSLSVARKPAALSHVEAAGVPLAALTAWGLVVETARAHEGQSILIHAGSGGVGHFAVQFAAYFGARVTATASGHNTAWLKELGAVSVIDYTQQRFEEEISDVDVVIDLVGNSHDDTGARSLDVLRPGGMYILVPTGSWPGAAEAAASRGLRYTGYKVAPDGATLATISRLLESGAIQVYIDQVFNLSDAAAAHTELEKGHTRGKIVLQVSDD